MPRQSKIEVSAINLRISDGKERNYSGLISRLLNNKIPIKVYANSFIAITHFDQSTGEGVFSKYSEIDVDGEWFDIEDFGPAQQEKVNEVSIPETLRPNLSAFYFQLYDDIHLLVFESYSESKGLSARSVEKYFRGALETNIIYSEFGRVEADIVKSFAEVERILSLPALKELRIVIRKPNPDDISGDLAQEIEKRLNEENAEELEEITRSKDDDGIAPNERTKALASVGAENGNVSARSIVNGLLKDHSTDESPEKVEESYSKDDFATKIMFGKLSKKMKTIIESRRKSASGSKNV